MPTPDATAPAERPTAHRRYVPRFAGEAFGHDGNPNEGPDLRRLVATKAWKQPPSARIRSQVAV